MRSHWITYNGQRILYCDYTNFALSDFDDLKAELADVEALLSHEPEDSTLGLSDIRGSVASKEIVEMFKGSATRTKKYIRKQAVVGVTGLKKILFDAVVRVSGQNARAFEDMDEAKEWLVED